MERRRAVHTGEISRHRRRVGGGRCAPPPPVQNGGSCRPGISGGGGRPRVSKMRATTRRRLRCGLRYFEITENPFSTRLRRSRAAAHSAKIFSRNQRVRCCCRVPCLPGTPLIVTLRLRRLSERTCQLALTKSLNSYLSVYFQISLCISF